MIRSPIHYMGNKYELLEDLKDYFPLKKDCDTFIDLFGGSGCVSLNVDYSKIIYNELNKNMVDLLSMFKEKTSEEIINHIKSKIQKFNLPLSSDDIRNKKTNKESVENRKKSYNDFRNYYNKSRNILDLYTLTFFSFSNMIRFNSKNEFNMPSGNQYFTKDCESDITTVCDLIKRKNIDFCNKNAFDILANIKEKCNTFVYCDPPYTNTTAIYNEQIGWTIEEDYKLFNELDRLNKLGIKWALSNVLENKGKTNNHIKEWANANGYKIIYLERNYVSLGKGNANSQEILVINYKPRLEQMNIFDMLEE